MMSATLRPGLLMALAVAFAASSTLADTVYVNSYSAFVSAVQNAPVTGRTVVLAAGTYNLSGSFWIYDKPNLTIQGATGNPSDVVIVGLGINNASQHHNIAIDTCPNFTIENVTLKNSYYHGLSVNDASHNCVIRNCILWDNGESGVKATHAYGNASARYSDYGIVENCRIGFTTTGMRSVVEGVDLIATKGWIIRNNVFINVTKATESVAYGCFPKGNAQDSIIENNYFLNCDIAASFGGGGTGSSFFRDNDPTYEHRNGIIRNNIMVGSKDAAVYLNKSLNAKVHNNLAYKCVLTFQARFAQTSATFRNNIAVRSPSNPSEPVVRWRDGAVDLGSGPNVAGLDSWFVAPAVSETADFHLLATAVGPIDTGYMLPLDVPVDRDGVARPQGASWDLGPYEYMAPNQQPAVNAGPDVTAVYEGRPVALHAAGSDPDPGDTLSYLWTQTAGKAVSLSGADTADVSFTAPALTSKAESLLTLQVQVSDGNGGQASDSVSVQVYMKGDATRDHKVNVFDLQRLSASWNKNQGQAGYDAACDFTGDNKVNVFDLQAMGVNWNKTLP